MITCGLIPIHPLTLVPNYRVGANVYLWNEKTDSTVKFLSSEQIVTESTFRFLLANPSQKLFVEDTCRRSYQDYLIEHLKDWLTDSRIPRFLKTAVIAEALLGQLTKAFENQSVRLWIECCLECSRCLAQLGHHIQLNGRELQRTLRHDSSFVTHAVNTAFYAYLIAESRGYGEETISEICAGAMLHDIGKMEQSFLDCNADLHLESQHDWTQRNGQSHPTLGFRMLCREPSIKETHLMACYQHHERPDGNGFPVGLLGDEIQEASKICAVANRFDGLTSSRSHRAAMTRLAALRVLESERNTALDSEVTKCLQQKMSQTLTN